jgi:hypothetical protein
MRIIFFILMLGLGGVASGTTYYVSSSSGSDSNSGTSSASAWKTIAKVNGSTFAAGDSILLKRGDVWNESLVPPSSGATGNPITFDAYGTGAAPNLTGYYAVPSSAWVNVTGNAWKALIPSSYTAINFCLFGSVWGQKVSFGTANLTAQWDFYLSGTYVYVYSVGNPSTYYPGAVVPMALSNVPLVNVNGKSWLTFQHLLVNWFDDYGVYVQGTSDHLVFANMEADSMIPQGTQPLGFYVNESTPGPGDIKIYNAEAHMNYDGFRFDGAATAITMVNDKAYANRDGALVDNTGAVTYSYCHFYASSLAVAGSTDVLETVGTGPTAGAGNIAADIPPAVQAWERYPGRVTLTVDDAGMTPGADTYYGTTVVPIADAAGVPVGAAITVGYPLAQTSTLISEFQTWISAGRDVTAHSISHTYYTNTNALDIQYTGSGTAATLTISGKVLTITVTGAADSVSYNLGLATGQTAGTGVQTILGLFSALNATGKFSVALSPLPCQGPYGTGCSAYTAGALLSQDLADVSGQDVKSNVYDVLLDVTRLTTDEITLSRQWMTTNLTGLPTTPVYVYPGGYEDPNMEAIAAGVPYVGGRGALHEGGTSNLGVPITGVKDTYASGFDVQDITSFGVNPSWMGLTPTSLQQKVQALVWKEMVWGVPWGIFWHYNATTLSGELSATEVTNLIADLQAAGATIQTNTGLVNWLLTGTLESGNDGNFYYKSAATSMTLDFRPTAGSPVVDAGENLGTAYEIDINGLNQNSFGTGWEIGAHAFAGYATYGEAGASTSSYFSIGAGGASSSLCGPPLYACSSTSSATVQTPNVPPFVSTLPTGTVNTSNSAIGPCSPTGSEGCMQWVSGQPFNVSWSTGIGAGNGGNISINGTHYGVLAWNSPTVATLMTNPGTQTGATFVNYTACAGNCLNAVGYDTSLNPAGLDPIVRASDGGAVSGRTLSSTASGGDNDEGFNCAGRSDTSAACKNAALYLLTTTQGGCQYVEGIQFVNGVPQVVAPLPSNASTGTFSPCGSITWSHQNPWVGYFMGTPTSGPQVNDPVIYSITYSWSGVVGQPLTIGAPVAIYDIGLSSGILPNGQTYNAGWSGPLSEDINDQLFWIALSNVTSIGSGAGYTANLTNGSTAFTMVSGTLPTDGSLVDAVVVLNGVTGTYTISSVNGGGTAGTITPAWSGTNGTYSLVVNGGQGTGVHEFSVRGTWSGTPGESTFTASGAALYNTFTGIVTASGTAAGGAIDSTCAGAHIHDSFGFSGTQYVQISGASTGTNCGTTSIFWNALTTHVVPCTGLTTAGGSLCGGHNAFGRNYETGVNNPDYYYFLPSNANTGTPVAPFQTIGGGCENHFSWRNDNAADTVPIFLASGNNNYSTSTTSSSWTAPYYNEIDALPISGASPIRFAHSFILGPGNAAGCGTTNVGPFDTYFTAQYAIGITSQDGRLFEWSSSMLGNLGADSSAATRADIFVVALDGGLVLTPSPMFGFTETGTGSSNFPTVSYGMQRLWDSPPLQWPSIETAANTFTFTNLDTMLAQDYSNGVTEAMYTLARTPPWITSQPTDTTCNYQSPAVGGGNGECFAPSDLNADGSGTNATWKGWITKIAQHANGQDGNVGYLTNHAHIRYWEIWNEPDAAAYWSGSLAQLARLTEDANCIITGRGVIHPNGDGSAVACTATAIDPTARIVMSSGHATSAAVLTYAQNQLYCNNTAGIPSYELPCPNPANAIASAVDILNYHLKPGNTTGNNCPAPTACTPETAMAVYMSSIRGTLQPPELAKPIWDGEMSYSISGFTTPYSDQDMAASFLPRMYLMMWSLGISGSAFYTWDSLKAEPTEVQTSYQQTYNWLAGAVLTSPCSAGGTVYQCGIVKNGVPYWIIWDSSQSCSGGSCTTGNQSVTSQWGHFQDMTSGSTPAAVTGSTVAVGIKPVVLSR